jgi:hypothetical protein
MRKPRSEDDTFWDSGMRVREDGRVLQFFCDVRTAQGLVEAFGWRGLRGEIRRARRELTAFCHGGTGTIQ